MGAPKGYRGGDPAERFRDLQLEGVGKEALAELVHELKVHQEELSAQNHQLVEAQSALEESRDRYVDLYDFAPIGYMTISPSGTIRELNLTAAAVLGREREKVVGLPFSTFVLRADKPRFSEHLRQCQQAEQQQRDDRADTLHRQPSHIRPTGHAATRWRHQWRADVPDRAD